MTDPHTSATSGDREAILAAMLEHMEDMAGSGAAADAILAALRERALTRCAGMTVADIAMERDAAIARAEKAEARVEVLDAELDSARASAAAWQQRAEEMREALTWYASEGEQDKFIICQRGDDGRLWPITPTTYFSDIARRALSAHPAGAPDAAAGEREGWIGRTHDLKTWPRFFDAVASGAKPFEIRANDRDYRVGDRLILREFDPATGEYSGRSVERVVSYVTDWHQQPHHVVLGMHSLPPPPNADAGEGASNG